MTDTLSEAAVQILLALSDQPRHGLGVAAEVESRTQGRVTLGASTLPERRAERACFGSVLQRPRFSRFSSNRKGFVH